MIWGEENMSGENSFAWSSKTKCIIQGWPESHRSAGWDQKIHITMSLVSFLELKFNCLYLPESFLGDENPTYFYFTWWILWVSFFLVIWGLRGLIKCFYKKNTTNIITLLGKVITDYSDA